MSAARFQAQTGFLSLLFFVIAPGLAQDRGRIRGVVNDETAAAVPAAVVPARNVNTGLTQTAVTSAEGVYNIPYLPVGEYTVTTEKTGFRRAEATNVIVNV